jgi:hypothetical protein
MGVTGERLTLQNLLEHAKTIESDLQIYRDRINGSQSLDGSARAVYLEQVSALEDQIHLIKEHCRRAQAVTGADPLAGVL